MTVSTVCQIIASGLHFEKGLKIRVKLELNYILLDNAIKYNSEKGTVTLHLYIDGENAVINIRDTGIGIEPIEQHRIFERFYRVDEPDSSSLTQVNKRKEYTVGVKFFIAGHNNKITSLTD
jgi:sensor histidine kinase YesM